MKSKKLVSNRHWKNINLSLLSIYLFSSPYAGFTKPITLQSSGLEKCKNSPVSKVIPKHLCYRNKKLGFLIAHYQLVKDFDSSNIASLSLTNVKTDYPFLSRITVTNLKSQKLVYQVSLDTTRAWNKVWGYHRSVYFKLYEYYHGESYLHPKTKREIHLLKSIRYYGANGSPGKIHPNVFKKLYIIKNKSKIRRRLKDIHITSDKAGKFKNDSKDKLILEIHYKPNGDIRQKKYISTKQYRTVLLFL